MTRVYVAATDEDLRRALEDAVARGGGTVVEQDGAPQALIGAVSPSHLGELLQLMPSVRWVQLGGAGIDAYAAVLNTSLIWTSAKIGRAHV